MEAGGDREPDYHICRRGGKIIARGTATIHHSVDLGRVLRRRARMMAVVLGWVGSPPCVVLRRQRPNIFSEDLTCATRREDGGSRDRPGPRDARNRRETPTRHARETVQRRGRGRAETRRAPRRDSWLDALALRRGAGGRQSKARVKRRGTGHPVPLCPRLHATLLHQHSITRLLDLSSIGAGPNPPPPPADDAAKQPVCPRTLQLVSLSSLPR